MAGYGNPSVRRHGRSVLLALIFLGGGAAAQDAQTMYRYQDGNGNWVFTDRKPHEDQPVVESALPTGELPPSVEVTTRVNGRTLEFVAQNSYVIPVEVVIALDELHNVEYPEPDQVMRWLVDPKSSMTLMSLAASVDNAAPAAEFRYISLPGDPRSVHAPVRPYRAPFAVANEHQISQAFPLGITHTTPDSWYAVDFAMPIGTDIYAARGGLVFEVASTNYRGGLDPQRDGASANIVRIMHDDGSHAVYAHLNWNSIRVRPGDRVERGEYIADSGNTGFSTGPHLHFAVMVNRGMRLESVPIMFEGPNLSEVAPATGNTLPAY